MIFIGSKKKFFEKYVEREKFDEAVKDFEEVNKFRKQLEEEIRRLQNDISHYFAVGIGDTVYDVQFKTKSGRFCSHVDKASKSKSTYVPKEVTLDNFATVQRALESNEMFATEKAAKLYISLLPNE